VEIHTEFWVESPKERDHSEDRGVDKKIIKGILDNKVGVWTEVIWLRIGTGGRLL
jgi:hypothetical protein